MSQDRTGPRRNEMGREGKKSAVTTWRKTPHVDAAAARTSSKSQGKKAEAPRKGAAKNGKVSEAGRWSNLWRLHRQFGRESLQRLLATPAASLMTVLVLGIALALPAALSLTLENLKTVAGNSNVTSARISLYLENQVSEKDARRMREDLLKDSGIAAAVYISPTQGLAEFEKYSGLGDALRLLDSNPLPGVIEVEASDSSPLAVSNLQNRLKRVDGVAELRVDSEWLKKLNAIVTLGDRILTGLSVLICLAVLLVVGNTIRLLVVNRRDEIRVIKLVGGSDGFVLLPFLYSGFWYGLAGGVLCWLIVACLWLAVSGPASDLATLYQSTFRPEFPGLNMTLLLIGGGAFMGVSGALLSSWRQLRDIDP
ncbi:permease-like cell division protein FtsX [Parendozoicomonas haliclonae]|uniref:Cell division protein FtsX n=1 Tax=Parendozoicomonas haliclonae TaxID=1960125 RepID=A0A1X7ALL7_9GAMM|nr:permease-like cell division protein FtsX [Parendozoicomonas haliclonae]SMA48589.1 Cell division protein FtsX [Parendozoicomonas haliclonae]